MLDRAGQIRHWTDTLGGEGSFTGQELMIQLSPTEDKGWGYCSLAGVCSLGEDSTGESSSTSKETFSTQPSNIHSLGSCSQYEGMKAFVPWQGGQVLWKEFEQSPVPRAFSKQHCIWLWGMRRDESCLSHFSASPSTGLG